MKTKFDEILKKQEEEKQRQELIDKNYKICFSNCLNSKEGILAFKLIKDLCLWDSVCDNTNSENEIYRKGRRDIWLMIRKYISPEKLAEIEIYNKYKIDER